MDFQIQAISPISGDKTEVSRGGYDFWLLKLDTARNIAWQKALGGTGDDQLFSLFQTPDGGHIADGSFASGISGERNEASNGGADYWIMKLDLSGGIVAAFPADDAGAATRYCPVGSLLAGHYMVAVTGRTGVVYTQSFVKVQ